MTSRHIAKLEALFEKVAETVGLEAVADAIDRIASKHIDGDQHDEAQRLSLVGLRRGRQRAESGQEEKESHD